MTPPKKDQRQVVWRAEVLLAAAFGGGEDRLVKAHGADALDRGRAAGKLLWQLADEGSGSYSPRALGSGSGRPRQGRRSPH